MAETGFAVLYDGPAVESGRMDVRDLAPALLALADMFREVNAIVNPGSPPVSLDIRATEEGSFVVQLILAQPELVDHLVDFWNSDPVQALANLKELIIGGPVTAGLFRLIKWLRGRQAASSAVTASGEVVLTTTDGDSLTIPARLLEVHRSVRVRRQARAVVEPLDKDGIDRLAFRSESLTTVELGEADVPAFDPPGEQPIPLLERDTEMVVSIASVAFTEGNKWRLSDGDRTFYATIDDEAFLQRVDRGEEAFRKGDFLRSKLKVRQEQTSQGLHTEYIVTEVLEHIPAPRSAMLPLDFHPRDDG